MRVIMLSFAVGVCLIGSAAQATPTTQPATQPEATAATQPDALPRLIEFGSTSCVPCKRMKPVLELLAKDCAGRLAVEIVNVVETPDRAKAAGITLIPTQVFLDAAGKEIDRHTGFISAQDIIARFAGKGVKLQPAGEQGRP